MPRALEWTAKQIINSQYLIGGTNNEPNPLKDMLKVVASSRLHRLSATAYYTLANPLRYKTVQVNFLDGRREPIIVQVGDGNIRGVTYEAIFDCGVALVSPEAAQRNAGA